MGEIFLGLFLFDPLESSSFLGIVGSNFSLVGESISPSNSKKKMMIIQIKLCIEYTTRSTGRSFQMMSNDIPNDSG